jgi:hypothetical protein
MTRVHVCTFHACNRILEKLVHLQFHFIWTVRNWKLQKRAIDEMQKGGKVEGPVLVKVMIRTDEILPYMSW